MINDEKIGQKNITAPNLEVKQKSEKSEIYILASTWGRASIFWRKK